MLFAVTKTMLVSTTVAPHALVWTWSEVKSFFGIGCCFVLKLPWDTYWKHIIFYHFTNIVTCVRAVLAPYQLHFIGRKQIRSRLDFVLEGGCFIHSYIVFLKIRSPEVLVFLQISGWTPLVATLLFDVLYCAYTGIWKHFLPPGIRILYIQVYTYQGYASILHLFLERSEIPQFVRDAFVRARDFLFNTRR